MSYAPMNNTYMAPAPQYAYATQPAVYATAQMPVMQSAPMQYTQPAPVMATPPVSAAPVDDAPPGYRLAGYAPAPDAGALPEGWEFVNGKWIYVGKPEPVPQPVVTQPMGYEAMPMPMATNYTSMAMPLQQTYTQPQYVYAQPQVFSTQQMPMTYGSAAPVAQYY